MKQPVAKNLNEEKLFVETEKELKKNVDELMVWLGGTIRYFVRSMKGLSELSTQKSKLRSYVTERLFDNLKHLSEIADLTFPEPDNAEKSDEDEIKESLKGFDVDIKNQDELSRYYKSSITCIVSENYEEFQSIRLHLKAIEFVSKNGNEYGSALLNYVCENIVRTSGMSLSQRIANLLCLVMAVKELDSAMMGDYAESIDSIVDQASLHVCMAVTTDFINSKKKEEEEAE